MGYQGAGRRPQEGVGLQAQLGLRISYPWGLIVRRLIGPTLEKALATCITYHHTHTLSSPPKPLRATMRRTLRSPTQHQNEQRRGLASYEGARALVYRCEKCIQYSPQELGRRCSYTAGRIELG